MQVYRFANDFGIMPRATIKIKKKEQMFERDLFISLSFFKFLIHANLIHAASLLIMNGEKSYLDFKNF